MFRPSLCHPRSESARGLAQSKPWRTVPRGANPQSSGSIWGLQYIVIQCILRAWLISKSIFKNGARR
jgi:hypothetical protein